MDGVLLIRKEPFYTSRDVVNIISKELGTKKVGHTGTLDPMAEGLLVICVGEATKLVEVLSAHEKVYEAEITLGLATDTLDLEGNVLEEENISKTKEEIETVLKEMVGTYLQEVPIYSAVKVNGKKLYEYARSGKEVELPKKEVTVFSLDLISDISYSNGKTIFKVRTKVSKGTYIRSLVRDIAKKLGTVGVMSKLVRTNVGGFSLLDAVTLTEVKENHYKLYSITEVLSDYPKVEVDSLLFKKVLNGAPIQNIWGNDVILFCKNNIALALYRMEGEQLKSWKMFHHS